MSITPEAHDEELKARSKAWWSQHSQDYVEAGAPGYLGVPAEMSDQDFSRYIDSIDRNFALDAYFAQAKGAPFFSALMPTDWLRGKKVLEIGCGLGSHTEALVRAGAQLTAIDLSPKSVATTRRRLDLKALDARIIEADAEQLPFADGEFDYVWSWGVIHHSPNTRACAREIVRVLRPGGRFGVMLYNRNSLYNWLNVILRHGVLQAKLLKHDVQTLHNMYTDGKNFGGAPLSKYYTRRTIREELFPGSVNWRQRAYDHKKWISNFFPAKYRRAIEQILPNKIAIYSFSRLGFFLFSEGEKAR